MCSNNFIYLLSLYIYIFNYIKGPFEVFEINVDNQNPVEWTSLKFSNNGKYILISTQLSAIICIY